MNASAISNRRGKARRESQIGKGICDLPFKTRFRFDLSSIRDVVDPLGACFMFQCREVHNE
jgi:hypothetical protein